MKIVDLSLAIDDTAFEVHDMRISRTSHKDGVRKLNKVLMGKTISGKINYLLGKRIIKKEDLPDEEFLSLEVVHSPVHIGTHLDYSYHYGSKSESRESKTAEKIPLEWCMSDGVKLNFCHKNAGETITKNDITQELKRLNYRLKPLDIVLFFTGRDKLFGKKEYFSDYPAVDISAIDYLLDNAIKIFGVDTMGIDKPYQFMIKEFMKNHNPKVLWPAHFYGRIREFIHIERLGGLDKLPDYGFKIHCLPIKIRKTGAAWARAIAILN
jgi:kynurenine formamidase